MYVRSGGGGGGGGGRVAGGRERVRSLTEASRGMTLVLKHKAGNEAERKWLIPYLGPS